MNTVSTSSTTEVFDIKSDNFFTRNFVKIWNQYCYVTSRARCIAKIKNILGVSRFVSEGWKSCQKI